MRKNGGPLVVHAGPLKHKWDLSSVSTIRAADLPNTFVLEFLRIAEDLVQRMSLGRDCALGSNEPKSQGTVPTLWEGKEEQLGKVRCADEDPESIKMTRN